MICPIIKWSSALLLFLISPGVFAQSPLAVLGIEAVDAPDALSVRISKELRRQVKASSSFTLVVGQSLDEIKLVFGCVDEKLACMASAGKSLKVSKLIWGTLKKVPGGYNLTIKLLDVAEARIEKFVSENYAPEDLQGNLIRATLKKLTQSFFSTKLGSLRVQSSTPSAQVLVDRRVVGSTGANGLLIPDVAPGPHEVRVRKEGFEAWSSQVTVLEGEMTDVVAELVAVAGGTPVVPGTEPTTPPDPRKGWKVAFWSGLIATLGFTTAAAVMGAKLKQTQDDIDDLYESPEWQINYDAMLTKSRGQFDDLNDQGESQQTLQFVFYGLAGGAAILTAISTYYAFFKHERSSDHAAANTTHHRSERGTLQWHLAPFIGPTSAALELQLRY